MQLVINPHEPLKSQPLTPNCWSDFERLFASPGVQNGCWCMYWRMRRKDFHQKYGEPNRRAFKEIVDSGRIPGILLYRESRPVGWCSIAPRIEFESLERSVTLKRVDDRPVWSIVCFFIARDCRGDHLSTSLIEAAIDYAKKLGASIIEAYPLIPENTVEIEPERYTGLLSTYLKSGFVEVARRSKRRAIVRYYAQVSSD